MALTAPSTAVAAFDKGRLAAGISASDTTITVGPIYKTVNGVRTKQGFDSTSGECIISQGDYQERISFEGSSVNATTKVTSLTTCTRGLPVTNTTANFTGGTGRAWAKGAYITVVDSASYNQSTPFKNVANTFTDHQTLDTTKELRFNSSATAVWKDGSDNLSFKDAANGTKTLTQLAAAGGTDEKVKVSSNDTTQGYLNGKLVAGAGITLTENSDGSNETLSVVATNSVATGHTGLSTLTSGALLQGAGTSNVALLGPGTLGTVPRSTGSTIAMARVPFCAYTNSADSNDISSGGSYTLVDWNTSYTIPANDLADGTVYEMYATGVTSTSGDLGGKWGVKFGSNVLLFNDASAITITSAGGTHVWTLRATIICRTTGASGTIQCSGELDVRTSNGTTIWKNEILVPNSTSTVDTTGTLTFCPQFGWQTDTNTRVSKVKNIYITRL